MRKLLAVTALLLLAGCGFQLRGVANLPFNTLYVDGGGNPALATEISRLIETNTQTRLADMPANADAVLQVQGAAREKRILSLSGAGRVREYQLLYRVNFRLFDKQNRDLIANQPIELWRDMAYDDAMVLAKEQEETLLYRDMENDAIIQLMRRLAAAKLPPADVKAQR
ncbi:MAG: LPS assembly lipoprotein LptE [Betaproteobacteria bacterium]|nr:LPS assembly lipoprotein LptE [Betaproteobacteria bacterium]